MDRTEPKWGSDQFRHLDWIKLNIQKNADVPGLWWVVIDRQDRLNACDSETLEQLAASVSELAEDPRVRVVGLTGAGGNFSSGADITELAELESEAEARKFAKRGQLACDAIQYAEVPVVATISGYCVGGGLELAMSCDIRVADHSAVLGQVELGIGSIASWGGMRRLPRIVGSGTARDLIYTARHIDAATAKAVGLVDRITTGHESVALYARELAASLKDVPREAVAASKRVLNEALDVPMSAGLQSDADYFGSMTVGNDFKAGVARFLRR